MPMTTIDQIIADNSWANSEQPDVIGRDMSLTETATWQDYQTEEHVFTRSDIETVQKKVSRKIKQ